MSKESEFYVVDAICAYGILSFNFVFYPAIREIAVGKKCRPDIFRIDGPPPRESRMDGSNDSTKPCQVHLPGPVQQQERY